MNPMNEQELRELDYFIAEHVMGWHSADRGGTWHPETLMWWKGSSLDPEATVSDYKPSTYPALAMQVLEKCAEKCTVLVTKTKTGECCISGAGIGLSADTLPTAIALFAKQLFSK